MDWSPALTCLGFAAWRGLLLVIVNDPVSERLRDDAAHFLSQWQVNEWKQENGSVSREWRSDDSHKVERWRAALQPMHSPGDCPPRCGTWLPIEMSPTGERSRHCTRWHSEAFSVMVRRIIELFHGNWKSFKLQTPNSKAKFELQRLSRTPRLSLGVRSVYY